MREIGCLTVVIVVFVAGLLAGLYLAGYGPAEGIRLAEEKIRGVVEEVTIPPPQPPATPLSTRAVENARSVLEAPYLWGGKGFCFRGMRIAEPAQILGGYWYWDPANQRLEQGRGLDCSGLILWAYNKAWENMTGRQINQVSHPDRPVRFEGTSEQWYDRDRMEHRHTFEGASAVTNFLNAYKDDPGQFGLLPGDPIYFLDPNLARTQWNHVVMYIGDGQIIHASGYHDRVVEEPLVDALTHYTEGGDWFRLVGLGRVRAPIDEIRPSPPPVQPPPEGIEGIPHGFIFVNDLSYGMSGDDVRYLQIALNADPDTRLAETGPGSPGHETDVFGPLTKAAVIRFQEKYAAEILAPLSLTEGTGFVGPRTRAKLNALLLAARAVEPLPEGIEGIPHGFIFVNDLSYGMSGDDVRYLQIALNADPDTRLAETGPGSPGHETDVFGPLTKAAVIRFQEKYAAEILAPLSLTEGTGFVGPRTRAKLNALLLAARE